VTSSPSVAWAATIRSTAVLANTARAVMAAHSCAEQCSRMCPASTSVASMAFSQAITALVLLLFAGSAESVTPRHSQRAGPQPHRTGA